MTWYGRGKVAVAGVGYSSFARRTDEPLANFATAAVEAAVQDCGLEYGDIDGLATYPPAPYLGANSREGLETIPVEFFLSDPRLSGIRWYSQSGFGLVFAAVRDAVHALIAGACDYALVWRAMHVPAGTYGHVQSVDSSGDSQFTAPYGLASPVQWHALAYRRYLELYGGRRTDIAPLILSSRRNANLNPNSLFRDRTLSIDEYLSARMIADPLCLFDCDVPVTACAAIILTTAERAEALKHPPAYVAAVGQQTVSRTPSISYTQHDHVQSGRSLAKSLWSQSSCGPSDMSAAQLYDGFSPQALYWLEAAGFCGRGEALGFIQDGRIELDGALPVNTFGGSLSQGRLHGMGHLIEAALQVSGRAGLRQIDDANAVCVFDGSPMLRGGGLILTSCP